MCGATRSAPVSPQKSQGRVGHLVEDGRVGVEGEDVGVVADHHLVVRRQVAGGVEPDLVAEEVVAVVGALDDDRALGQPGARGVLQLGGRADQQRVDRRGQRLDLPAHVRTQLSGDVEVRHHGQSGHGRTLTRWGPRPFCSHPRNTTAHSVACPQHPPRSGETSPPQASDEHVDPCMTPSSWAWWTTPVTFPGGSVDGYYAFMLVATAFVLMMTVPALALFYGGMSRSKSVLNMMMMSFIAAAIVGILYVAVGWSMGFGGEGTFFANPFELLWLDGVTTDNYIYVMFQMTFAIITAALISGAVADRLKFSAWVVFLPLWALIVYFPMAHMVFSCTDDSLICGRIGAQDYAGGTAVHINAGVAALVLVLLLGKRIGWPKEQMRPHNLTLTMLGAGMLWLGWYGFNVGSIVFGTTFDEDPTRSSRSSTPRPVAPSPTPRWPPSPPSSAGC